MKIEVIFRKGSRGFSARPPLFPCDGTCSDYGYTSWSFPTIDEFHVFFVLHLCPFVLLDKCDRFDIEVAAGELKGGGCHFVFPDRDGAGVGEATSQAEVGIVVVQYDQSEKPVSL